MLIFSIVKAKIIHYSSLCYFPLTFLAAYYIYKVWKGEFRWASWLNYGFVAVGLIMSGLLIILPFFPYFKDRITPLVKDRFAVAAMQADVYWSGFEAAIGLILLATTLYAAIWGHRRGILWGAIPLFIGTMVVVQGTIYLFIPKIERYSQGAAIDFFKSVQDEDAYKTTLDFHSYAQLFYGRTTPEQAANRQAFLENHFGKNSLEKETYGMQRTQWNLWLMRGNIDKPAYFVTRVDRDKFQDEKNLKKLGEKNGYIFYMRPLQPPPGNK
ncbi:MAG: hypothetical protein HC880_06130 [Bacteroidia bacterium]|nr:hypothetical protein [Bacteroidia bacterium]